MVKPNFLSNRIFRPYIFDPKLAPKMVQQIIKNGTNLDLILGPFWAHFGVHSGVRFGVRMGQDAPR